MIFLLYEFLIISFKEMLLDNNNIMSTISNLMYMVTQQLPEHGRHKFVNRVAAYVASKEMLLNSNNIMSTISNLMYMVTQQFSEHGWHKFVNRVAAYVASNADNISQKNC
jgi:hypothetical protein